MELNCKLYSKLPDAIIYKICCLTGQFILRYDKKLNKTVLVSIINLNDQKWIDFTTVLYNCFIKPKRQFYSFDFGTCTSHSISSITRTGVSCSLSSTNNLVTCIYFSVTLPPIELNTTTITNTDSEQKTNRHNRRRRGDKKRFKYQFAKPY
jgi:hypothetical protein